MLNQILKITIGSFIVSLFLYFFYTEGFINFLLTWLLLSVYIFFIIRIRQFILELFPRQIHKFLHIIVLLPLFIVLSFCIPLVYYNLTLGHGQIKPEIPYRSFLYISVILAIFFITIFEGIDFFIHWKKYIIRSEQIEKANLLAKYETLRNQLNPHFLFNGLNTLISFIETQDMRAAGFAQNLADFLKYLLTYNKQELITVEDELVVVNQYVYLQSARFEGDLFVSIDIAGRYMKMQIPPLSLQMLVENAIKHNKISAACKLHIDIYEDNGYLYVKNNVQLKDKVESAHVGLENIRGRYKLFTDKEIQVVETKSDFIVGFPLLKNSLKT